MTHNPILKELYAIREQLLADAGGDLQTYLAGVRDREATSGPLLGQREDEASKPDSSLADDRDGTTEPDCSPAGPSHVERHMK
ncbi:MAG: hypothetical protein ABI353_19395 [Isosphaeraceae bacterium]